MDLALLCVQSTLRISFAPISDAAACFSRVSTAIKARKRRSLAEACLFTVLLVRKLNSNSLRFRDNFAVCSGFSFVAIFRFQSLRARNHFLFFRFTGSSAPKTIHIGKKGAHSNGTGWSSESRTLRDVCFKSLVQFRRFRFA